MTTRRPRSSTRCATSRSVRPWRLSARRTTPGAVTPPPSTGMPPRSRTLAAPSRSTHRRSPTHLRLRPGLGDAGAGDDAHMLEFGDETARRVEAVYTTPDVVAQRVAIRAALAAAPGERVLDIGSGPGFLAAEIAEDVGPAGRVDGVDMSESMLALARGREVPAAAAPLGFARADALDLPFDDRAFDAAVSTQVLEYVEDIAAALAEARRVLRPGGRLLILDTDWDSIVWHSTDEARTRRVLAAWNEHLADPYLPRRLPRLLADAAFDLADCTVIPILNRGYDPRSYSAGLIDIVAAFVPGRGGVTAEEAAAWVADVASVGADGFFSLNRYLFVAVCAG